MMIVVTGAAGFIGSCQLSYLAEHFPQAQLVAVDELATTAKAPNLKGKNVAHFVHRLVFHDWLVSHADEVDVVFHLGARTDTTEKDPRIFNELNLEYSQRLWKICVDHQIPLLYASSAATYGGGEHGYSDAHQGVQYLKPLNPYGASKNDFDKWALSQKETPPQWAGFKFFNVFGPNEFHKGRMASVVFHAFNQIKKHGKMKLFKSHRPDIQNGHQSRDFVYIVDVLKMINWIHREKPANGLYNIGSGTPNTFLDLVQFTFEAMGIPPQVEFIDTPEDIRDSYQYYTCAEMEKLKNMGYKEETYSFNDAIKEYVQQYLTPHQYY
jgi:ADP-L-glycero-D-manno-heptose 6-epimerase